MKYHISSPRPGFFEGCFCGPFLMHCFALRSFTLGLFVKDMCPTVGSFIKDSFVVLHAKCVCLVAKLSVFQKDSLFWKENPSKKERNKQKKNYPDPASGR